ncbi:hypothetical protein D0Z70_23060 [Sphingobium terrigena]|jgi:hypothetical protein|uniref:Uncharacterized protein n=2 Tax=Sphingobium TaxID=165695 RepID=A0A401J7P4_SPHXE|nr:hypothetical protein D0Z70_23060 [Sphingobium terrigena]GBH32686.1 hypothetical protein MBESOW_P3917 [Sphingobium xenophagum]
MIRLGELMMILELHRQGVSIAAFTDIHDTAEQFNGPTMPPAMRISQKSDSCFAKSRTSASVNPGQLV